MPSTENSTDPILRLLREYGAIQQGHFLLASGLHSPHYVQCALVLQYPHVAARLAAEIADRFRPHRVQTVVGPAIGGITLAYEVARQLGARAIWAERADGKMTLRRSFAVSPQEIVLVAEDVVTTGGSANEVVELVQHARAHVVGVGAVVDRSGGAHALTVRFEPLVRLSVQVYPAAACPLCQAGVPLTKPGSRAAVPLASERRGEYSFSE
ncbi:MAG: orotate phosphoribosyltransferase [Armatimonadota bacterium]|nr:orotate phosphoribosyltransferase [Armatimonadota bacterium]MDR5697823.1 orotate phosphoribosyltransferase [Armatimonadota bacterium]